MGDVWAVGVRVSATRRSGESEARSIRGWNEFSRVRRLAGGPDNDAIPAAAACLKQFR